MTWKCYVGKAVEFKAKYEGTLECVQNSDMGSPICGTSIANFSWLTTPKKVHIGKGFYVEPDLPHGITPFGPESSLDLELILTGPGLSQNGQKVIFKWALSPCFGSSVVYTVCKQFMNVEVVKSKSGASEFTIEFVSGYSEQQYIVGSNVATWVICYDGPFEMVMMEPFPNIKEIAWTLPWIWGLISELKESGSAPSAKLLEKTPLDAIGGAITTLANIRVPKEQKGLRDNITESLQRSKDDLSEAASLMQHSNDVASEEKRLELRTAAINHLEKARSWSSAVIEMVSQLEQQLKSRPYTYGHGERNG